VGPKKTLPPLRGLAHVPLVTHGCAVRCILPPLRGWNIERSERLLSAGNYAVFSWNGILRNRCPQAA
jgi:hypothetical protein